MDHSKNPKDSEVDAYSYIKTEEKYVSSADKINEILHNAGVNKNKRARFIAGLILSLSLNEEIDLRTEKTKLLVDNINNLIKSKLEDVGKDNFYDLIKLEVPPSKENHIKYKRAIIDTLKELQNYYIFCSHQFFLMLQKI